MASRKDQTEKTRRPAAAGDAPLSRSARRRQRRRRAARARAEAAAHDAARTALPAPAPPVRAQSTRSEAVNAAEDAAASSRPASAGATESAKATEPLTAKRALERLGDDVVLIRPRSAGPCTRFVLKEAFD